jgi:hypothetical protein
MRTDDVRRLNVLEQENNRLKTILAERDFEIEVMKQVSYLIAVLKIAALGNSNLRTY